MCKGKNCENLVGNEIGKIIAPSQLLIEIHPDFKIYLQYQILRKKWQKYV